MDSVIPFETLVWRCARCDRPAEDTTLSRRTSAEIRDGFLEGEHAATTTVQGWVRGVVHGGWRFRDADAVVQEILLELVRLGRSGSVRDDRDFKAYVQTVTRHTCVDIFRRERLRAAESLDDSFFEVPGGDDADPEQAYRARHRRERLRYILQGLEPGCRTLLRWAYADERSSADIADQLDITAGNARVRLHRCLERARALYREYFP